MIDYEFSHNTIKYPYVVISDIHLHNWSAFSHTNSSGVNNRLQHILDAIELAANSLQCSGGSDLVITGDLFHTRGSVKPSVLNPATDLFRKLTDEGFTIHAIPGNHDLEGKNSDSLGNALHTLCSLPAFHCYVQPTLLASNHLFIPWYEDSEGTQNIATKRSYPNPKLTVFCHVGMNDVVPGKIGNTLNPSVFLEKDFKYVFAGHFHNHVQFDNRVFSVGALTHQTWNDVGSKAGFLIVHEDRVEHHETNAPKFIDITAPLPKRERWGNYFRIKGVELSQEAVDELTKKMKDYGALAVLDQSTRPSIIEKTYKHSIDVDLGVDAALEAYCKNNFGSKWKKVLTECLSLKS
jgi:DNA repair exonuclease SbcCD nuclease subunit